MKAEDLKNQIRAKGASLVGVADLSALDDVQTKGFKRGIAIAMVLEPEIVADLKEGPTCRYHETYISLNEHLDELGLFVAELLEAEGYQAYAQTREQVTVDLETLTTPLPHKTIATVAGLGWVGKCALLVTPQYGSAIRLTTVLTNAPLAADAPVRFSSCDACDACMQICPGNAVEGVLWEPDIEREQLYNAVLCRKTARSLAEPLGIKESICGRCIWACPYTQAYLNQEKSDQ